MDSDIETMCLEIPAQPALVGVARNVVAATARSSTGIDAERLEDLRLAVSEACTTAVEGPIGGNGGGGVVLRCLAGPDHLEVRVEYADAPSGDPRATASARAWSVPLMQALVDDVEILTDGRRTTVRLVVRRVSR